MSYVVDRQQAFLDSELVAVLAVRQRGIRSRVLLRDGSSYQTLTRPKRWRTRHEGEHGKTR